MLVLVLISLIFRLVFIWRHSAPITYDQGRDLLDIRRTVIYKRPPLIGPTTSLHGLFYGPFWYYLILPFYILTGGHPLSSLGPLILFSVLLPFFFLKILDDKEIATVFVLTYSFSWPFFINTTIALNTNPMVYIVPVIILCLSRYMNCGRKLWLALSLFLLASGFHFNFVIAASLVPAVLLLFLINGKIKSIWIHRSFLPFFLLPFIPQLIFDLRHDFIQTKSIIPLIEGKTGSLSISQMSPKARFLSRFPIWYNIFLDSAGRSKLLAYIFLFLIAWIVLNSYLKNKPKNKEVFSLFLTSLVLLAVVLFCLNMAPFEIWPWYLNAVSAMMVTLIGVSLAVLYKKGRFSKVLSIILLFYWLGFSIRQYWPFPLEKTLSSDPANLRNRIQVIDRIYQNAAGKGFNVYTFAPYVYDYPYQYLIWWRAKNKYGYVPEEYVYLSGKPIYVAGKKEADALLPVKKSEFVYLIIEPYESQKNWFIEWRNNFSAAVEEWEIGATRIEKLGEKI